MKTVFTDQPFFYWRWASGIAGVAAIVVAIIPPRHDSLVIGLAVVSIGWALNDVLAWHQLRGVQHRQLLSEVYQVVGVLADDAQRYDDEAVVKVMDNLVCAEYDEPMKHASLLPFPSKVNELKERLLDIEAIDARAAAAAPGPWKLRVHLEDDMSWLIGPRDCDAEFYDTDAYFIANVRTDVPALVAEVRRLRARLELVYAYDSNLIDALERNS